MKFVVQHILTNVYRHNHYHNPSPSKISLSLVVINPLPPTPSPWQPHIWFLSLYLCLFWMTYKGNHSVVILLCLAFFTVDNILRSIPVVTYLSSFSFFCWMVFHWTNIWQLCILSLLDGHCDCLQFLAVMNTAVINV